MYDVSRIRRGNKIQDPICITLRKTAEDKGEGKGPKDEEREGEW